MKIPPGHTEGTVLAAIEKSVTILAKSFVFGPYTLEDMRQQARLLGIQALEKAKYDPKRPLENYLYRSIRNGLINFQRDKLRRNEPPCAKCHAGENCGEYGQQCVRYADWFKRNRSKANILLPVDLSNICDEHEPRTRLPSTVCEDAELNEMLLLIDEHLPIDLRGDYLKMRDGVSIPKARRLLVEAAVKDILKDALEWPSEDD